MEFMLNKICFYWEIIKLDLIEYYFVVAHKANN
jgi:hypothetical protein